MRELIFLATGAIIGGVITLLRNEKDDLQQQVEHERRTRVLAQMRAAEPQEDGAR